MTRDIFIKVRATKEEREEWKLATKHIGGLSEVVRGHLKRVAKRELRVKQERV